MCVETAMFGAHTVLHRAFAFHVPQCVFCLCISSTELANENCRIVIHLSMHISSSSSALLSPISMPYQLNTSRTAHRYHQKLFLFLAVSLNLCALVTLNCVLTDIFIAC